jgi:uncharacterized membrane protein
MEQREDRSNLTKLYYFFGILASLSAVVSTAVNMVSARFILTRDIVTLSIIIAAVVIIFVVVFAFLFVIKRKRKSDTDKQEQKPKRGKGSAKEKRDNIVAVCAVISCIAAVFTLSLNPYMQEKLCGIGDVNKFTFKGWTAKGGLAVHPDPLQGNTVVLNGKIAQAELVNTTLNTSIRGKTVVLTVKNAMASDFENKAMLKIVRDGDVLISPKDITTLVYGEYVPQEYERIEFDIPHNFNGKLSIVFVHATLRDLAITASYK